MSDYILPSYENAASTYSPEKMSDPAPEGTRTDTVPPPLFPQPAIRPRHTWHSFLTSYFSMVNLPHIAFTVQFIAIAVAGFFLLDDFHTHPQPLAIWWLSMSGSCIVFGVWSSVKIPLLKVHDELVDVTDAVKADRIYNAALDSVVPWLSSAISLCIAYLLFKF